MKKILVSLVSPDSKRKSQLQSLIEKKSNLLEDLMEKVEMLTMELEYIQHEYNVRIGSLLLKDNQLDLEILQLKNLKELMKGGMSYQKAMKYEEDTFYSEMLRMQQEQEKIAEEKQLLDDIQDVSEEVLEDIKQIWKKLIRQFHPDLVTDPVEKTRREEIMKKINKAYTERNIEALKQFESTQDAQHMGDITVEELEILLEKVENALLDAKGELIVLQKSTWYEWKKKKDKGKTDVFAQLEQKFLDDIVKKIEIVQKLREDVHPKA